MLGVALSVGIISWAYILSAYYMAGCLCIVLLLCSAAFLFLLFLVLCAFCEGNLFCVVPTQLLFSWCGGNKFVDFWSSLPGFWFFCNMHSWIPGRTWCGCWCSIYGFISLWTLLYENKKQFSLLSSTLITFLIQGAMDGGLDIPHSEKRFTVFSK